MKTFRAVLPTRPSNTADNIAKKLSFELITICRAQNDAKSCSTFFVAALE